MTSTQVTSAKLANSFRLRFCPPPLPPPHPRHRVKYGWWVRERVVGNWGKGRGPILSRRVAYIPNIVLLHILKSLGK